MRLTDIRIDKICYHADQPEYALGRATFSNGSSYRFDARISDTDGKLGVFVFPPEGSDDPAPEDAKTAIEDRLGFTDIARRQRAANAAFHSERATACQALIRTADPGPAPAPGDPPEV